VSQQKPIDVQDELTEAIEKGDLEGVIEALRKGASLEAPDSRGREPVYLATFLGRHEILALLLSVGAPADPLPYSSSGNPLLTAVYNLDPVSVRLLLENGASVGYGSDRILPVLFNLQARKIATRVVWGETPCRPAKNRVEVVRYLGYIDRKRDGKLLLDAARLFPGLLPALMEYAQNPEVNAQNELGLTPLHYAVINLCLEGAEALLQAGASVHKRDRWGRTPLDYAKEAGPEFVDLLTWYDRLSPEELERLKGPKKPLIVLVDRETKFERKLAVLRKNRPPEEEWERDEWGEDLDEDESASRLFRYLVEGNTGSLDLDMLGIEEFDLDEEEYEEEDDEP